MFYECTPVTIDRGLCLVDSDSQETLMDLGAPVDGGVSECGMEP